MGPVGPFRNSHLTTTADSLAEWASMGYNPPDVVDFLAAYKVRIVLRVAV